MLLKSFGLGITQGWLWLFFLNGPLLYKSIANLDGKPENIFMTFLLFNSISYLLIAIIGKRISPLVKKTPFLLISMSLITIGTLLTGYNLLVTLGTIMSGFGSAILISAWGERYSTFPAHRAALAFSFAVTVGTVIFFTLSKLALSIALLTTALLPVLSAFLLLYEVSLETETDHPGNCDTVGMPFPAQLVNLVILFYLAGGLMHKIIASGQEFTFNENFWLTNIVYFAVCLSAGAVVHFFPNLDLRLIYKPILPLLGVGFLLFPVLHSYAVVPFTFLQTGFALFDLYTWTLFAYFAARQRFPAGVIAWGMFLITSAIFTGELLFTEISSKIIVNMKETDLISLLAALLMFIGTLVFKGNRQTFAGWDSPSEPIAPDSYAAKEISCTSCSETSCSSTSFEQFAIHYVLTPREQQISMLLLEGRNNPYIRENLNVSNNTLKTHLRNIYRKLSISDRQQLLDLYMHFKNSM